MFYRIKQSESEGSQADWSSSHKEGILCSILWSIM